MCVFLFFSSLLFGLFVWSLDTLKLRLISSDTEQFNGSKFKVLELKLSHWMIVDSTRVEIFSKRRCFDRPQLSLLFLSL